MTTKVVTFPRIHIGLLDLAGETQRAYGGAGFLLNGPVTEIEINVASQQSVTANQLSSRDREDLKAALGRLSKYHDSASVTVHIKNVPQQHVGLGSKTGMILGLLSGVNDCLDLNLSKHEIQRLSSRGGVSGIGINAFFTGGFIVDCGQPSSEVPPFTPSSFAEPTEIPPVVHHSPMPESWEISLFLPQGSRISGECEKSFFETNTPIQPTEVQQSLSTVYHGIIPSIIREDLQQLSDSLARFHNSGFKLREVKAQSQTVREVLDRLQNRSDTAAGMSSLGPLVYAIHEAGNSPEASINNEHLNKIGIYDINNTGALVNQEPICCSNR